MNRRVNFTRKCAVCKKSFYPRKDCIKRGNGFFCSIKCHNINQKGKHHSKKTEFKKGTSWDKTGHWKGGTMIHKGYILKYCPDHPYTRIKTYVPEHRLVMEKYLGRYIKPNERVHHINHIKTDNRLENLMLFSSNSEHQKFHWKQKKQKHKLSPN